MGSHANTLTPLCPHFPACKMEIIIQYLREELWGLLNILRFAKCSQTFIQKGRQEGVVVSVAGALPVCLLPSHPIERRCWVACLNGRPWCMGCSVAPTTWGPLGVLLYRMGTEQWSGPPASICAMATPQPLWQPYPRQDQSRLGGCWMVSLALSYL